MKDLGNYFLSLPDYKKVNKSLFPNKKTIVYLCDKNILEYERESKILYT